VEDAVSDHQLKGLMEQLGDAVHQTLSGSNMMADVLDDIKLAGYSVSLSVDATFSEPSGGTDFLETPEETAVPIPQMTAAGGLPLTDTDESFLRALRISV
jgi:hypothetical protein